MCSKEGTAEVRGLRPIQGSGSTYQIRLSCSIPDTWTQETTGLEARTFLLQFHIINTLAQYNRISSMEGAKTWKSEKQ